MSENREKSPPEFPANKSRTPKDIQFTTKLEDIFKNQRLKLFCVFKKDLIDH